MCTYNKKNIFYFDPDFNIHIQHITVHQNREDTSFYISLSIKKNLFK